MIIFPGSFAIYSRSSKNPEWFLGTQIQLLKTGQYLAGRGSEQTHTGNWTYDHQNTLLFLQPGTEDYPMSEWNVMSTNEVIVLVGTQTYGNNATQIQLIKSTVRPQ